MLFRSIQIPEVITVRELADLLDIPVNQILMDLLQKKILATVNQTIDPKIALEIAEKHGFLAELKVEGKEFSLVEVKKTGENQKLVRVVTNSGFELECTPYHKFYVSIRNSKSGHTKVVEKRAYELKEGDKLIKSDFPIIQGSEELAHAYENGFFSADGCLEPNGQRVYLYHEKRALKNYFDMSIFRTWNIHEDQNREYGTTSVLKNKFFVPNGDYTIESKLKWLAGSQLS